MSAFGQIISVASIMACRSNGVWKGESNKSQYINKMNYQTKKKKLNDLKIIKKANKSLDVVVVQIGTKLFTTHHGVLRKIQMYNLLNADKFNKCVVQFYISDFIAAIEIYLQYPSVFQWIPVVMLQKQNVNALNII